MKTKYKYPVILEKSLQPFRTDNQKEIALLSNLIAISGCFPNYTGQYGGDIVNANLYGFILAPPASGKSAMKYSRELLRPIEKHLERKTLSIGNEKGNPVPTTLMTPSDCSSAMLIKLMKANSNGLVMIANEADTLTKVLNSDFGNFSDVLRSTFHHEEVAVARSTDNHFIRIRRPKLSLMLTGTPNQLPMLIRSSLDGLFSRFIFLRVESSRRWHDVSNKGNMIVSSYDTLGKTLKHYFLASQKIEQSFELTKRQWKFINLNGENWLKRTALYPMAFDALVFRMGLIMFRIAMVLSVLRQHESGNISKTVTCSNDDLIKARDLCEVYLDHGLGIAVGLSKTSKMSKSGLKPMVQQFYEKLPSSYRKPEDVIAAAQKLGVSARSGNRYHQKLVKKNLVMKASGKNEWRKAS